MAAIRPEGLPPISNEVAYKAPASTQIFPNYQHNASVQSIADEHEVTIESTGPLNPVDEFPSLAKAIRAFNQERTELNLDRLIQLLEEIPNKTDNEALQGLARALLNYKITFLRQRGGAAQEIPISLKISALAGKIFDHYPDIHNPKVKRRGFTLTSLDKETGFVIKYFKYAAQIYRRWSDDIYAGLRTAVEKFNLEKSPGAIEGIIKQISLLKSTDSADWNDETLMQIANEAALTKLSMLAEQPENIVFNPKKARKLDEFAIPEVQAKIQAFNKEMTKEKLLDLMKSVFDLMRNDRVKFSKYRLELQILLYQAGSGIEDPQLGELFGLLQTEKTLLAYHKIAALEAKAKKGFGACNGAILDIPQVNTWFSRFRSKELRDLKKAVKEFNQNKTPEHYQQVLTCIRDWQYVHNNQFNNSNGLKILSEMTDILSGVSMQDRIKSSGGFKFYETYKKIPQTEGSKWSISSWDFKKWNRLPPPYKRMHDPSEEMGNVIRAVNEFNTTHNGELIQLYGKIETWMNAQPAEFNHCGGNRLLEAIRKNILNSVSALTCADIKVRYSPELESVHAAIRAYNKEPKADTLKAVQTAIGRWESVQQEFVRFHGSEIKSKVESLLQKGVFPTLLLPDSHPAQVFEKGLAVVNEAEGGRTAYLMIFHNPIAPWSHTDIGFVTGPPPLTPALFVSPPSSRPDLDAYFQGGDLVKSIVLSDFPHHRPFMEDLCQYVIEPFVKPRTAEDFQNNALFNYLKAEGFLDADGVVQSSYFSAGDDHFKQAGFDAAAIAGMRAAMPEPLVPGEFDRKINEAKSREAFDFLKRQNFLTEEGKIDPKFLTRNSELWIAIDTFYKSDDEFADFLKSVLATPIPRTFTPESFQMLPLGPLESEQVFNYLKAKGLTEGKVLKAGWEKSLTFDDLPAALIPFREEIVHKLAGCKTSGEVSKREYLAIGTEEASLDSSSQYSEGVRLTDARLTSRLEKICKRRKNEIQRNFNVFSGAMGGVRSLYQGAYATLLVTKEDKLRHIRQALIDNYLTSVDPQAFLPDLKEVRYRLEVYESGGEIYRKWVEDPNGQFSRVKNPSSQDSSGEFVEGEYKRNSYALVDGKLKSIKKLDKERMQGQERGHVVLKADGTKMWKADEEFGQYFKAKGAPVEEAERDERPLYSAMNCEKYLANGEKEWCGSATVRMLQSAYAFEYMPEFESLLKDLTDDLKVGTGLTEGDQFEKRHAQALFLLADQYSKKIVESEAGRKYFRDMHPTVRLSPRCTPDMIHEFLMGKTPGIVTSMRRAYQTIRFPKPRGQVIEGVLLQSAVGSLETGLSILAIPTALMKLATNVIGAVTGTVVDIFIARPQQAAQQREEELSRKEEAGKKIRFKAVKIAGSAASGFAVGGIKRIAALCFGGLEDLFKKKEPSAFA